MGANESKQMVGFLNTATTPEPPEIDHHHHHHHHHGSNTAKEDEETKKKTTTTIDQLLVELQSAAPPGSISVSRNFSRSQKITLNMIPIPLNLWEFEPPPMNLSPLTNNVLKSLKFQPLLQKLCISGKTRRLSGWLEGSFMADMEEAKEFFQAIGQLNGLESIELQMLDLPLSLFTNVFHQEEEDTAPLPRLKKIRLDKVTFSVWNQQDNEINKFISSLQKLPNLECITTNGFVRCNDDCMNNKIARELVKLPFKGMVNIDVDLGQCILTTISPEEKLSTADAVGGTWVFTDRIEFAIEAVQGNNQLEHLEFLNLLHRYHEPTLQEKLEKMAPVLAEALSDPSCNVLDTLIIGSGPVSRIPSPCAPVLLEIANVLPRLSVCKLDVSGLPSSFFYQTIKDKLSMKLLGKNKCTEEMSFFLIEDSPFRYKQQACLRLNRFHRSHFGKSRKEQFDPLDYTQEDWGKVFMALSEQQEDINLFYHYYHLYPYKSPQADNELLSPPENKARAQHDLSPSPTPLESLQLITQTFMDVAQMPQEQQAEANQSLCVALNGLIYQFRQQNNLPTTTTQQNNNAPLSSASNSGMLLPPLNGTDNNGLGPGTGKNASKC